MGVHGGRDAEDDGHQGLNVLDVDSLSMEVADGGSLECASCGDHLPWCRRWRWWCRRCWCYSGIWTRWKWYSDVEDVGELELDSGCGSSRQLGLGLDGGNMRLDGGEGIDQADRRGGIS
jgi:hypothetical protein